MELILKSLQLNLHKVFNSILIKVSYPCKENFSEKTNLGNSDQINFS